LSPALRWLPTPPRVAPAGFALAGGGHTLESMRAPALVVVLLAAAPMAPAEVTVRLGGDGRVDVRATTAPLPEVLDHLSRQTGMKVIYDGPVPRPLLTLTLERRTPVEALLGILEGLGLNYAVVMDRTATRVETLLMTGTPPVSVPSAALPLRATTPTLPRLRAPEPVEQDPVDEPPEEEAVPPATPGQPAPGPPLPGTGSPVPPAFSQPPITLPGMPNMVPPPDYPVSPFTPRLLPSNIPIPRPSPGTPPATEPTAPP
jgi:hypothetical protein